MMFARDRPEGHCGPEVGETVTGVDTAASVRAGPAVAARTVGPGPQPDGPGPRHRAAARHCARATRRPRIGPGPRLGGPP